MIIRCLPWYKDSPNPNGRTTLRNTSKTKANEVDTKTAVQISSVRLRMPQIHALKIIGIVAK